MKHIATMALMLTLGVAGVYAQQIPVKMTFSGTGCGQRDRSKAAQHKYRRREFRRERYAGLIHVSNVRASTAAPQPSSTCSGPNQVLFSKCGRRGRISLPGWESVEGQSHAGRRLHRFRGAGGPLYSDLSNHRWNRPFQGCVRRPYVYRDVGAGVGRRLEQPRLFCRYGGVYGNGFRSQPERRTAKTSGNRRYFLLVVALLSTITDAVRVSRLGSGAIRTGDSHRPVLSHPHCSSSNVGNRPNRSSSSLCTRRKPG